MNPDPLERFARALFLVAGALDLGTGLGLVIAKRCVELHYGRIRFQSEEGKGTTFHVLLPIFPGEDGGPVPSGDTTWFFRKTDLKVKV